MALTVGLLSGRVKRLLQLLAHGLGELVLQLVKDGLDGLADLLLERLMEVWPCRGGLILVTALVRGTIVRVRPSGSRRPSRLFFVV